MRSPNRILVVGQQETGKTATAIFMWEECMVYKKYHIAILFDDDEDKFKRFPAIFAGEQPLEFCKIVFDEEDEDFFEKIRQTYKNSALLIDDTMMFLQDRKNENFRKIYMRSRQRNNDVICTFHGLSEVPPSFYTFATDIILHKSKDSPKRAKEKINEFMYDKIVEMSAEINAHPNPYYKKHFKF